MMSVGTSEAEAWAEARRKLRFMGRGMSRRHVQEACRKLSCDGCRRVSGAAKTGTGRDCRGRQVQGQRGEQPGQTLHKCQGTRCSKSRRVCHIYSINSIGTSPSAPLLPCCTWNSVLLQSATLGSAP